MALTPKKRRFAAEYLVDLNATKAAVRAGYSKKTARAQGARLLTDVDVKRLVAAGQKKVADQLELDARLVLSELLAHARYDFRRAYDKDGRMLPPHQLPDEVARVVTSSKVYEDFVSDADGGRMKAGETRELKFSDKLRALELLGKHLRLFADKVEHDVGPDLEQLLRESMEGE